MVRCFAAQKRRHRLTERGQEVGIEHFNLDRLASNTLASHRLVQWITKLYGCIASEAVYNVLNYKHFVEGKKLNDTSFLCETAAATAGANYEACSDFLATDSGITEIEQTQVILRNLGINQFQLFCYRGKYVVMLHSTELVRVFREIEKAGQGAPGSSFADALQIPINVRGVTLPPPTGSLWI